MTHRALVTLPATTGLPEDVVTNTFHFQLDPGNVPTAMAIVETALMDFYNNATQGVAAIISQYQSRVANAATIKWYDLADPTPRIPVRTTTFTLIAPNTTTNYPRECAIVLSFQAVRVSGLNQARRRGRVYIGPICSSMVQDTAGDIRPSALAITKLTNRASALKTACLAANSPWGVYSPTGGSISSVADGWVDNALDTQRRRGVRSTGRTTWT